MGKVSTTPRGIRNNNPLNIRIGNTWLGETAENTDKQFEQFVHIKYGLRAGFVLLRRYIKHYKLNTVNEIISRWAPMNENNTASYINRVCVLTGFEKNTPLKFEQDTMMKLVAAMCKVENGVDVDLKYILQGWELS